MPDTGDPEVYLAGAIAIMSEYPVAVMNEVSSPGTGTKLLKSYPSLHDIRAACETAYAPIERAMERQRAMDSHKAALPAPRGPDEARRAEQIADYKNRIRPMLAVEEVR